MRRDRWPLLVVWLLVVIYTVHFASLSILQHWAFETGADDLGNMNQAAWYTLHYGYPADTRHGQVIPRFAGHVEPIFYLIAMIYALHQRAETLLALQTIGIALGALPAFWLGRAVLGNPWAGVTASLAYLLTPALEAANLTEFHPVTLAASLVLFAFWYASQGDDRRFLVSALLLMSVKEDMSLLVVMLGLFVMVARRSWRVSVPLMVLGLAWFLITVYAIIPRASPTGSFVLFQRYAELGGSPTAVLRTAILNPSAVLTILLTPERLSYLVRLLAPVGGLALAAPAYVALCAPSLAINLLSNYPPMFSGLSHYSAPIVPFLIIAAVYGARAIATRLPGSPGRAHALVLGWLVVSALTFHYVEGFTPLGRLYRIPQVTGHYQAVTGLVAQIPSGAALAVDAHLHPHVSGRQFISVLPNVGNAEYVLLDVTTRPTMHPSDLRTLYDRLTEEGYGLVAADDGAILLRRGEGEQDLPDQFYRAFRDANKPPQKAVVDFGENLRLLGFGLEQVDEGRQPWTRLHLWLEVRGSLPSDLRILPVFTDAEGRLVEDTIQRPLVALLWYPPQRWSSGEVIKVSTLPWPVGDDIRVRLAIEAGGHRLPPRLIEAGAPVIPVGATAVELGHFRRRLWALERTEDVARPSVSMDVALGNQVALVGYDLTGGRQAEDSLTVRLVWRALGRMDVDYQTFVHLYDARGRLVAQSDGPTGGGIPTSWWIPGQIVEESRQLVIPTAGSYRLVAGIYRLDTLQRLSSPDGQDSILLRVLAIP